MFRRTSQKSVLRERSNSQIFPYIIHSLQPKRGIAPLHEVGEEILRTDEREGKNMNAMEGSSTLPVRPKDCYQMSLPQTFSLLIERIPVFRKTWKAAHSHMRTIHILPLQSQWRLLLAHPAGLSFTEGTSPWGSILQAKNWCCTSGGIIISSVGQQHL